jgi:hypothetical protein
LHVLLFLLQSPLKPRNRRLQEFLDRRRRICRTLPRLQLLELGLAGHLQTTRSVVYEFIHSTVVILRAPVVTTDGWGGVNIAGEGPK